MIGRDCRFRPICWIRAAHRTAKAIGREGSRGARRVAESAPLPGNEVFPGQCVRQWVLSVPYPLRFLFASRPAVTGHRPRMVAGVARHAGVAA